MSLITRCPACETMFKVVPDQLRVSDGWVRCGQCAEIFNASQHLVTDPDDPFSVAASSGTAADPQQEFLEPPHSAPGVLDLHRDDAPEPISGEPPSTEPAGYWAPANKRPSAASDASLRQAPDDDPLPSVSFMRNGAARSIWRRPALRATMSALLLLLLAAFATQLMIHERDRIAAFEPSTRPLLSAICAWVRCELSPLRQIESIVIDSSSFTRIRDDSYRLGFSLRNNAPVDLAMPALELALTDGRDQPVIRRVFLATELGPALLGAGSEWSNSLALGIKTSSGADRIAGYRLLAFYP